MTAFEVVQTLLSFGGFTIALIGLCYKIFKDDKNILRLVVKKSPTGESTHYFFHSQDDKVEVS
ncbi:putative holin-like toxin, partial [Streptococcus sp. SS-4456]|uniref:putative holin-like toxin n=1 Tax=Streptococcus sp. SS-4456 TaxID=3072286 RepID=UPI003FA749F1